MVLVLYTLSGALYFYQVFLKNISKGLGVIMRTLFPL